MYKLIFLLLLNMLLSAPAWSAPEDSDLESVTKTMQQLVPDRTPDSVKASVLPGLYEVVYGMQVIYVSRDGRYVLEGDLLDVQQQRNLSEEYRSQARLKIVNDIPESSMIVFSPKQVKHTVTVFTDIDCGYCRKLHSEIDSYTELGIRIRYLAYPRAGIGSHSYDKAVSVWCAKDRQQALTLAKSGQEPEVKKCDDQPVDRHFQVGRELKLSGTPMMVLDDGRVIPGYVQADSLAKMFEQP